MLCLAKPHQATLNILTDSDQCVCSSGLRSHVNVINFQHDLRETWTLLEIHLRGRKGRWRSGNNSVEERKRQRWKERVRKFRANIILQFTLCFLCRAWGFFFFYMSAVIRSDTARQQMPSEERPSGRTHRLHLHSTLQQHEAKRWGCCCSATQCQCRAYYGWRHEKEKKTDCITVLGGRLWRVTHHRKPASLHEQRRSPAVSFGNICCRSQL